MAMSNLSTVDYESLGFSKLFLDYVAGKPDVWFARRVDIALHWHEHHLPT